MTYRCYWIVCIACTLALLAGSCAVSDPDNNAPVYRVGIVSGLKPADEIITGFKEKMTELGYIENEYISYDIVHIEPMQEGEAEATIQRWADARYDLVVTYPTQTALWVKDITKENKLPMVFTMAETERNGLISNVYRPNNHLTGVRAPGSDVHITRFELLCEADPSIETVLITYNPNDPTAHAIVEPLREAASARGISLIENAASTPEKAHRALSSNLDWSTVDAVLVLTGPINLSPMTTTYISEQAVKHNIPLAGFMDTAYDRANLLAYFPSFLDYGKEAAMLADNVLKGASPGTLMAVNPRASLHLNVKRAQEIGLELPPSLIGRADEIIR